MTWSRPRQAPDTSAIEAQLAEAIRERDEARKALSEIRPLCCSFCGKSQFEVDKLIAGPTVFICNGCVAVCVEIIAEGRAREGGSEAAQ